MEVIGGSIRVPIFQKVLKEGLKRDILDMHLNGDETVALGSAFRAANVSTAFKPRFVGMSDVCPYSIGVELYRTQPEEKLEEVPEEVPEEAPEEEAALAAEADGEETVPDVEKEKQSHDFLLKNRKTARSMELFSRYSHYKTQRKITLQAYDDFQVYLYYSKPEELPEHAVVPIATYNITGIALGISNVGEKRVGQPNVTLVFSNDINGMVVLKDAYMKVRFQYQEEVEVEQPKEQKNVLKSEEKAEEEKKDSTEEKSEATQEATATEEKKTEDKPATEEKPVTEEKTSKEEKKTMLVTKRKIRKMSLRVQPLRDRLIVFPMSSEEKEKSVAL